MPTEASARGYNPTLKTLHWVVLLLLLFVLPLGFGQKMVKDAFYHPVNYWHVTLGIAVFWLMAIRIAVRLASRPVPPADDAPAWTWKLARLVQGALYALLLIQPVFGLLTSDAQGFPLKWFDVIPLPNPIGKSQDATTVLLGIHLALAWAIMVLIAVHVCGALYHRVVRRDDTLLRII